MRMRRSSHSIHCLRMIILAGAGGGRTSEWRNQKPLQLKWLRELDLNQRPQGYEPCELPGCSIPRQCRLGYARKRTTLARTMYQYISMVYFEDAFYHQISGEIVLNQLGFALSRSSASSQTKSDGLGAILHSASIRERAAIFCAALCQFCAADFFEAVGSSSWNSANSLVNNDISLNSLARLRTQRKSPPEAG
jgi:hypothetical protein